MIAFLLLLLTGIIFLEFPGIALLTGSAALYVASQSEPADGEWFVALVLYGALTGCLLAWFGIA